MLLRARTALLGAAGCVVLLAVIWFAAFHVGFFGHADQSIYLQFSGLRTHARIEWIAGHLVSLFDPNPYVYLVVAPVVVAMVRGRPRVVVGVAAIILGANLTTEVLKHVLAAPRAGSLFPGGVSWLPGGSWPSGHSTAVMSLVLASVLAAPGRLRPVIAALGASLAIAVGYSLLAMSSHYPSDVLGGFLVAATWTLATVATLLEAERRRPTNRAGSEPISIRTALEAPGAVLLAALAMGVILVTVRTHDVVAYARAHEAFLLGAAGIGALALAVSTGVLLSVRR